MLTETKIILPKNGHDGWGLAHVVDDICMDLCAMFGGCTKREAWGMWRGPDGVLYTEPVWEVEVAADWTDRKNVDRLMGVGRFALGAMDQLSVYVRLAGQVHFIEHDPVAMAAACVGDTQAFFDTETRRDIAIHQLTEI